MLTYVKLSDESIDDKGASAATALLAISEIHQVVIYDTPTYKNPDDKESSTSWFSMRILFKGGYHATFTYKTAETRQVQYEKLMSVLEVV